MEEVQNPSNHASRIKKKSKNQTPEGRFRFQLDRCSKTKDLAGAIALYDAAISQNIHLNHQNFNALLYLCSTSVADTASSETLESSKASALEYGFRIFDHLVSSNISPNEATITAIARLAAAKGDGDAAFDLIKSMGKYNALPRLRTYDPALFCFCRNVEVDKAYAVEEHMVGMGVSAEEPELAALLEASAKAGRDEKVYEYLHKLRSYVRCVSETTAETVESWFRSKVAGEVEGSNVEVDHIKDAVLRNGGGWHGLGWMGKGKWVVQRAKVGIGSHCCACGELLVCIDIDSQETEKFVESVASLAMEREAMTNFKDFQAWLDNHNNYEAIVDGANVGLYQQNFSEGGFSFSQLDAVMKELYTRSNKKWPLVILHNKRLRGLISCQSDTNLSEEWLAKGLLYATPNGSNDDWYWLYAAVKLKCLLVTNDEMRDHIFELLGRSFFLKWKERHQVRYTFVKGKLELQMPPSYSVVIQESEKGAWHVPLASENCDESSRTWLCITRPSSGNVPGDAVPSETGKPLSSNNEIRNYISENVSSISITSNGRADSFKVSGGDIDVAGITGKRKR